MYIVRFILILGVGLASGCASNYRYPVYLTWAGDPATTMTVSFHTPEAPGEPVVYYDTESRDGELPAYRYRAGGRTHQIPGLPVTRYVNHVELSGLTPGETYFFVAGDPANGFRQEERFHTIPEDASPLRFVVGGDVSVLPRAKLLLKQAAKYEPMFAVIGGDLAYANGELSNYYLWDIWLQRWSTLLRGKDGALVPMVLGIGNHEVNKLEGTQEERAPFFFGYFPQGGETYFARRFGSDLLMIMLDSGHITPWQDQVAWMEAQFAAHPEVPWTMAVYHVPLYPSVRAEDDARTVAGREHWLPIFDKHALTVGFEHHDHAFKRSKLLRGGEEFPEGTLYLGDGAFGVKRRKPAEPQRWYLDKALPMPHFWVVETSPEALHYQAVDSSGRVFDRYTQPRSVSTPVEVAP